jgi:hypothetical protein
MNKIKVSIPVIWTMAGVMKIEVNEDLSDLTKVIESTELPRGVCEDDSFAIRMSCLGAYNEEEITKRLKKALEAW